MKHSQKAKLEESMATILRHIGADDFVQEHRFHPTRRWRLDFAWPEERVAIEVQGGTYSGGGHTRGAQYAKDCEKLNAAQIMGWKVLQFDTNHVRDCAKLTQRKVSGGSVEAKHRYAITTILAALGRDGTEPFH